RAERGHHHAGGVGADAEQPRMAERNLPGVADHDVQPEEQDRVDHDRLEQVDVVRVDDRDREQHEREDAERSEAETKRTHTFLIAVLPNRPAGRMASTISSSTSPGTSL